MVRFPLILSEYKAQQKDQALATCIQSLLSKNAIERVENVKSLGFYSRLFLVPKPHQRWRPVIDLSRLNTFLHVEKFKMETPESIRTSLIPGEWVSSIDLSDVYLHIPIHPNSRKYLRFCYKSQVFQFTSLPFGLATAPQVFTMIERRKVQNGNSRVHQDLPDSRGVGIVDRSVGRLPAHPHPPKLKEIPKVLLQGYVLPFLSKPNLVSFSLIISEYKARPKDQALPHCIQSLLSKNVIERVKNVKSLGFYNRLFLVPMLHQGGGQL